MAVLSVSDAVSARRSIRAFADRPVDVELLRGILDKARFSPSGGNIQPWHATVLTGTRLERLNRAARALMAGQASPETPEYDIYPPGLPDPWRKRRADNGEALYASIGIARGDKLGRMSAAARNFEFFGAPAALLLHTPRIMGKPQWADLGMWLQTTMLLLVEAGIGSCPQESWSLCPETVKRVGEIPEDHMLFCGLAIGYPDASAPINGFVNPRAPLEETVRFLHD